MLEKIVSSKAPRAVGPYSHAMQFGDLIFCSGQGAIQPDTGELFLGSIAEQTRITLSNLASVLEAANSDLNHVLKTTVYLTDLTTFSEMNEVYAEFFHEPFPARATVEVKGIFGGLGIEIDLIAVKKS